MDQIDKEAVAQAVINRMIEEKGTYGFEDLCRLEAEEIWKRTGDPYPMSDDYFHGFLAACKFLNKMRK